MRRRHLGGLLLAALLLAAPLLAVTWCLLDRLPGRSDSVPGGHARPESREEAEPSGLHAAPQLAGRGTPAEPAPAARHLLRVRVTGAAPEDLASLRLHVGGTARSGPVDGELGPREVDPSGTTDVDVGRLVLTPGVHTLQVRVEGPEHLPGSQALALPPDLEERRPGLRLEVEVAPERAAVITGRVVTEQGTAWPLTHVTADRPGGAEDPEQRVRADVVSTDEQGRFRLRVGSRGLGVVLAAAPGWAPAVSAPFPLPGAGPREVGDVVLRAGPGLRGRVAGGVSSPVASVRAALLAPARFAALPDVGWVGAEPGWTRVHDGAPAERFELRGAGPGLWSVQTDVPDWGCALSHAVDRDRFALARAGGPEVALSRRSSLLRVVVRGPAGPLEGAWVELAGPDVLGFATGADGHGAIVYPPGTEVRVRVWHPEHLPAEAVQRTGADGEERRLEVVLVRGASERPADLDWLVAPRPRLRLALEGADRALLPGTVRFTDASGRHVPLRLVEAHGVVRWRLEDELLGLGFADLLTDLPAGDGALEASVPGHAPLVEPLRLPFAADPWLPGPPTVRLQPLPR